MRSTGLCSSAISWRIAGFEKRPIRDLTVGCFRGARREPGWDGPVWSRASRSSRSGRASRASTIAKCSPEDLLWFDAEQPARHEARPRRLEELVLAGVHELSRGVRMAGEGVFPLGRRSGDATAEPAHAQSPRAGGCTSRRRRRGGPKCWSRPDGPRGRGSLRSVVNLAGCPPPGSASAPCQR